MEVIDDELTANDSPAGTKEEPHHLHGFDSTFFGVEQTSSKYISVYLAGSFGANSYTSRRRLS